MAKIKTMAKAMPKGVPFMEWTRDIMQGEISPQTLKTIDGVDYSSKHFLVIDPRQEIHTLVSATLQSLGATQIKHANRVYEAFNLIKRVEYDVILSAFDLGFGHDGLHLLAAARRQELIKPSAVFIIISGERRAGLVLSAAEMKPDDYLLKPFNSEQLKRRLRAVYRRKQIFSSLDKAMHSHDYLQVLAECDKHLDAHGSNLLDFLKIKGQIALRIEDYDLAQHTYQLALEQGDMPWARIGLGKALMGLQQWDLARPVFEGILVDHGYMMEAYDYLAKLYVAEHAYSRAQSLLSRAVKLSAATGQRYTLLGEVAFLNGDFETAALSWQQAVTLGKHSFRANPIDYLNLCKAQLNNDEILAATRTLTDFRADFPQDNPLHFLMALLIECKIHIKQEDKRQAHQLLQQAMQLCPERSEALAPSIRLLLAEVHCQLGNGKVAEEILMTLLRNQPHNAELCAKISVIFNHLGQGEMVQNLIRQVQHHVAETVAQATDLKRSGDLGAAAACLGQAIIAMPDNVPILLNAIDTLLQCAARDSNYEAYMAEANRYLDHLRVLAPHNVHYLKLSKAYKSAQMLQQRSTTLSMSSIQ